MNKNEKRFQREINAAAESIEKLNKIHEANLNKDPKEIYQSMRTEWFGLGYFIDLQIVRLICCGMPLVPSVSVEKCNLKFVNRKIGKEDTTI